MSNSGILLVALTALLQVAANLLLRAGVEQADGFSLRWATLIQELTNLARQPLFDLGFILYGAASLVWFRVISTENLNSSYPLLVSASFLLVTIGATLFFQESISWQKIIGIGVILAGIVLISSAK